MSDPRYIPFGSLDAASLAAVLSGVCGAVSSDELVCTEPMGHDGWHRAVDSETGELFDTWPWIDQ